MPRKKAKKAVASNDYLHDGIKQYGDMKLYGNNPSAYFKQDETALNDVGPGDIVDTVDPKKRYTFYLFEPAVHSDAARELDRLRRAGYFKCEAPRFSSPTGKFETRDGVLVVGLSVWYACPWERYVANRKQSRSKQGPSLVVDAHEGLAASGREPGFETTAERSVRIS